MLLEIHPQNPQARYLSQAISVLQQGGVIIFPTDTIYAIGCDAFNVKATERLCRIMGKKPEKANLSLLCKDLGDLSLYTPPLSKQVFRLMKQCLPGPYTFILNGGGQLPKLLKTSRKTIGIRVPDNKICQLLIEQFGHPLISSSIHSEDGIIDYLTDPRDIAEHFEKQVDLIIDGGIGDNHPSTVIDCTEEAPVLVRQGKGMVQLS